jgi:hypothetical protein
MGEEIGGVETGLAVTFGFDEYLDSECGGGSSPKRDRRQGWLTLPQPGRVAAMGGRSRFVAGAQMP